MSVSLTGVTAIATMNSIAEHFFNNHSDYGAQSQQLYTNQAIFEEHFECN